MQFLDKSDFSCFDIVMEQKNWNKTTEQFSILLVDDEAQERSGVRFLIDKLGLPLTAREAPNGKRALKMLMETPADILFTDVKMPYMDGLELAKQVNAAFPKTRIIVFSAYGEFEYAKRAIEAQAVSYLLKPIDVTEFQRVMVQVIRQCSESAAQERMKTQQLLADKKLLLVSILSGKISVNAAVSERLSAFGLAGCGLRYRLVHIQTDADYFPVYESRFLMLLNTYAPCAVEYINLYPNSAYLILYGAVVLTDSVMREYAEKLSNDMLRLHDASASFMIGASTDEPARLPAQATQIDALRDRMLGWETPVIFADELLLPELRDFDDVERERTRVDAIIAGQNQAEILAQTQVLLDVMIAHPSLSSAYVHHVFCDLIGKLYAGFGLSDSRTVQQQILRLTACRGRHAVMQLFSDILSEISERRRTEAADAGVAVRKAVTIIHSRYGTDLTLDNLADSVGLAPSYFSFLFKKETGVNLIKYITDYRMQRAKEMLDEGRYKIVQVAKLCGYENQSYFNRLFKNAYGVTPSQYRENPND